MGTRTPARADRRVARARHAHGFAQPDALRTKLITRTLTERTQFLAEIAFNAVPASALLAAVRQSGFNMAR